MSWTWHKRCFRYHKSQVHCSRLAVRVELVGERPLLVLEEVVDSRLACTRTGAYACFPTHANVNKCEQRVTQSGCR